MEEVLVFRLAWILFIVSIQIYSENQEEKAEQKGLTNLEFRFKKKRSSLRLKIK